MSLFQAPGKREPSRPGLSPPRPGHCVPCPSRDLSHPPARLGGMGSSGPQIAGGRGRQRERVTSVCPVCARGKPTVSRVR